MEFIALLNCHFTVEVTGKVHNSIFTKHTDTHTHTSPLKHPWTQTENTPPFRWPHLIIFLSLPFLFAVFCWPSHQCRVEFLCLNLQIHQNHLPAIVSDRLFACHFELWVFFLYYVWLLLFPTLVSFTASNPAKPQYWKSIKSLNKRINSGSMQSILLSISFWLVSNFFFPISDYHYIQRSFHSPFRILWSLNSGSRLKVSIKHVDSGSIESVLDPNISKR